MQGVNKETNSDMYVKASDAHNLLRPEFIESLYYMYYFTGNKTYQDWGWQIFQVEKLTLFYFNIYFKCEFSFFLQAFEKYTKVADGYTSINNVRNTDNVRPRDMTESFWLAETLKYLYLLFDDSRSLIDLDRWVFNSEGHPLPMYKS